MYVFHFLRIWDKGNNRHKYELVWNWINENQNLNWNVKFKTNMMVYLTITCSFHSEHQPRGSICHIMLCSLMTDVKSFDDFVLGL